MKNRTLLRLLAAFTALVLLAGACGSDEGGEAGGGEDGQPGDGVSVTMARADWDTGYFQAAVYRTLLEDLGYEVSDPADLELGPSLAYLAMAEGDADFWVNSWFPGHKSWFEAELPTGGKVGDKLTVVGEEMMAGGLQGYLITKATADEFGITHLDQLNDDPAITEVFDTNGDGVAEIFGCQESFTCDDIITEQICQSGWENITQTVAGYDAMMAQAVDAVAAGDPMVIYTWTPSAYITQLIPGDNVVWLAVEDVVDDSNCAEVDGGEEYSQLPGTANLSADVCPAAAEAGVCQTGWAAADIQVTGNTAFFDANPAAASLLGSVALSVIDVSLANVEQDGGCDSADCIDGLAATWIENNQSVVDGWMETARAAG